MGLMCMDMDRLIALDMVNVMRVQDRAGRRLVLEKRYASAVIVPLTGRIRFSHEAQTVLVDSAHPIFIPQGMSYLNECLESADSLLFNFMLVESLTEMWPLPAIDLAEAYARFDALELMLARRKPGDRAALLMELYALLNAFSCENRRTEPGEALIEPALRLMLEEYDRPELDCAALAAAANVSDGYLRKLFRRHCGCTPFQYLTKVRMERARSLLMERRPVKEVADSVGYSDIYQFSRAYRRWFGYPPTGQ